MYILINILSNLQLRWSHHKFITWNAKRQVCLINPQMPAAQLDKGQNMRKRDLLYWKKKCYYYLHCSNIIWYLYQYESILSSSCTSSWQILWITATMGFLIKFVSILILLWVCDFMEELLFCLKVFEVLSMKILSCESEYLMIFLILLKLTGITSISNLWNQRCRYLS